MTLPSSFEVDYLGSAKLSVPIDVPPGTAGMTPHLSLDYSSSGGNGYVGVGWSLSGLPAITRCPNTIATNGFAGPVNFAQGDVYCFTGQPLVQGQQQTAAGQQAAQGVQLAPGQQLIMWPSTQSSYGGDGITYTTEIEGFSRIVSHNAGNAGNGALSFTVYARSGLIYEYGGTPDSQVKCTQAPTCPAGQTTVMTWMLDKVTDTVGNTINITYQQDTTLNPTQGAGVSNARAYPYQINYTSNVAQGLVATNQITFTYTQGRLDAPLQYMAGQPIQTNWLLHQIVTSVNVMGQPTGNGWQTASTYTLSYGTGLTGREQLQSVQRTGASGGTLLPLSFQYCDACQAPADLLTTFNNGLSGPTTLTYALTTHSAVYNLWGGVSAAAYPTQNLTTPRYVVSNVSAPNGIGGQYLVNYSYWNGLQDLTGRGFLGFASVWANDQQTQLIKSTGYSQAFPTIGDVTSTSVTYLNASPTITVKNVATTYCSSTSCPATGTSTTCPTTATVATAYNGRTFPYVCQVVTTQNDLWGNPMPTTTQTYTPDAYGNDVTVQMQTTVNYGGANTAYASTGTYAFCNDCAGWSATNGKNWLIGRLTSNQVASSYTDYVTTANSSGTTTRLTTYVPDTTTGFVDSETVQPGSAPCTGTPPCTGTGYTLTTAFTYDGFGNKIQAVETGDNGATRTSKWGYSGATDPGHEFVDSTTNALNQTATYATNPMWGELVSATDINARTATYSYDDLGRRTQEVPPDKSTITTSYWFCNGVNGSTWPYCSGTTGAQYGIYVSQIGADGTTTTAPIKIALYDTLDRVIEADTGGFAAGSLERVTKTYNTQLQLATVTRPYFSGNTPAVTSYTYDALNRVIQTNKPDGSWDTVAYPTTAKDIYVGITSANPGEHMWKSYDGHGNLTNSIQHVLVSGNDTPISTSYQYDGFNNLTTVTDTTNLNVTSYTYDVLGRKTYISDPDSGTRQQSYTAFDELQSVLDGRGVTQYMQYDSLSRMVQRCWTLGKTGVNDMQLCRTPSADEINETWAYDPANGIGELGTETTTNGSGSSTINTYPLAAASKAY